MSAHDYDVVSSLARSKAMQAMHQGNPVRAREWIEAAHEAERAKLTTQGAPGSLRVADELERIADALVFLVDKQGRLWAPTS